MEKRIYGKWAGNNRGVLENVTRCIAEVWGNGFISYQCSRKRGHGENGLYCKQHARKYGRNLTLLAADGEQHPAAKA